MPKPGRIKEIVNPDDPETKIRVRLVEDVYLTTGSGPTFSRQATHLLNDDREHPTTRKVKAKTITHKALKADGTPEPGDSDDETQKLDVEEVQEFTILTGSGPTFQRTTYKLDKDIEQRKTHTKRVKRRDPDTNAIDDDTWLDIERLDAVPMTTGSGPTFQRSIITLDWDDQDGDDSVFDTATKDEKGDALPIDGSDPDDGFDPPWRLDWFQRITNLQWGGDVYVVVNVWGTSNFRSATREVLTNANGDVCPQTVSITGATPLYSRVTPIVYDQNNVDIVGVYGFADGVVEFNSHVQVVDGLFVDYWVPGGFWEFAPSDSAGIAARMATINAMGAGHVTATTISYNVKQLSIEAVFLLDSPSKYSTPGQFTVVTGGFPCGIDVYLYPKRLVKRDDTNASWALEGAAPDAAFIQPGPPRVWFPINWKQSPPPPPYPKDPDGNPWPGYDNILTSPNQKDVINTAIFWTFLSTWGVNADTASYPFKAEKKEHWSSQPGTITAQLADKIWQVYPTSLQPSVGFGQDNWRVETYGDKPLGIVRTPPLAWRPIAGLIAPGPPPLIPPE